MRRLCGNDGGKAGGSTMAGSIREGVAGLYLMTFPPSSPSMPVPGPVDIGPPPNNWYLCHLIVTGSGLSGHLGHSLMPQYCFYP